MKVDVWFPFYHGDYLKDTMQLSAERHGIYLLLIIHCWQNGYIEDDIESISIITKVDKNNNSIKYLLDKYFNHKDGKYYQNRILKEKEKATLNKEKRTEKAKYAAKIRWDKDATSNATSIPEAMLQSCPSSSSSSSHIPLPSKPINKEVKHKHGEYKHVLLTEVQYENLKDAYPNYESMITNLDEYIETTGKNYKNHNLVLRKWEKNKPKKIEQVESTDEEIAAIWK